MKKNIKKVISTVTAVSLSFALAVPTFAVTLGEQAAMSGQSTVQAPTVDLIMPLSADFLIDTFAMAPIASGSQISSTVPMSIANLSNIPIMFSVSATATLATGVTLMPAANVTVDDIKVVTKDAFFALAPAATTSNLTVDDTDLSDVTFDYTTLPNYATASTATATIAPLVAGKNAAKISFALDKAEYDDTGLIGLATEPSDSYTSFAYFGTINPNAPWADGDIEASLVFDIRGLTDNTYDSFTTKSLWVSGTHKAIGVTSADNAAGAQSTAFTTTVSGGSYSKAAKGNIVFTLANGTGTITSIKEIKVTDSTSVVKTWNGTQTTNATFTTTSPFKITVLGTGAINTIANGTANVLITVGTSTGDQTWAGTITIAN